MLASNGDLTATAATKGTHFVRVCTFRDIPLIFLQNTPSDFEFLTPGGNEGLMVKARAQMISAVACATVPKITIVVGGSYGPSSYAMVRREGGGCLGGREKEKGGRREEKEVM